MLKHKRFRTRVVNIGLRPLGGNNPVRVQSMLNTPTLDTEACIKQAIMLIEGGCEYVRVTTPGMKEAKNLILIKNKLQSLGYTTPLIADVHFKPEVAEYCARFIEKVRINPGNYADKKAFKQKTYTDSDYKAELERIATRLYPLLRICREYGTAVRIGTNHGSLSDRIINRYGDTPEGMVESTMEFLRVCSNFGFHNLVVSLKASNPIIMMEANRLLVHQMAAENLCFPLHLGVTEAGAGEDGRIKSALGIGTLLSEGIGDTIRVSLTENPVHEIPFARLLANQVNNAGKTVFYKKAASENNSLKRTESHVEPYPLYILKASSANIPDGLFKLNPSTGCYEKSIASPDAVHITGKKTSLCFDSSFRIITGKNAIKKVDEEVLRKMSSVPTGEWILDDKGEENIIEILQNFRKKSKGLQSASMIYLGVERKNADSDIWLVRNTARYSKMLLYRLIDGFYINLSGVSATKMVQTLMGIAQACRVRITRTEYISCPGCGRTSYDLESTLCRIKEATAHLTGLKIGVMGCIVNGPGEMADADYGYVGNAAGRVNLYRGQNAVKKNISQDKALAELIELLKEDGRWKDA